MGALGTEMWAMSKMGELRILELKHAPLEGAAQTVVSLVKALSNPVSSDLFVRRELPGRLPEVF